MLDATVSYKYGDAAPEVRKWDGLDKEELARLERALLEFLLGMNNAAVDKAEHGKPIGVDKTYADLGMEFLVTEGDDLWHKTELTYPHVGDGSFGYIEGLLRGWLARVPKAVRQKEVRSATAPKP